MRTQNEKLQNLVNQLNKFSKESNEKSKSGGDYKQGFYVGWTACYKVTAKWIQEIIDYELQDNENQYAQNVL